MIRDKHDSNFTISSFDKICGIQDDKFLTYLFLCVKYYLYACKFQSKRPNFTNLIVFIKKRDTEYYILLRNMTSFIFILRNGDLTCNFFLCMVNISELGYDCLFEEHCFLLIIFCMIIL